VFGSRASVYLLVPHEVHEVLRKQFGVNLKKRPRQFTVECALITDEGKPKLLYTFNPNPNISEEVKTENE